MVSLFMVNMVQQNFCLQNFKKNFIQLYHTENSKIYALFHVTVRIQIN